MKTFSIRILICIGISIIASYCIPMVIISHITLAILYFILCGVFDFVICKLYNFSTPYVKNQLIINTIDSTLKNTEHKLIYTLIYSTILACIPFFKINLIKITNNFYFNISYFILVTFIFSFLVFIYTYKYTKKLEADINLMCEKELEDKIN